MGKEMVSGNLIYLEAAAGGCREAIVHRESEDLEGEGVRSFF